MAITSWAKDAKGVSALNGAFGLCPKGDREHTMYASDDKAELKAKCDGMNAQAKDMGLKTTYEVYER